MTVSVTTPRSLIARAARSINFIGPGQSLAASEENDAYEIYREMLESWNNQGLALYATTRNEFTLTATNQTYTIGDGATFNIARPDKILKAAWQDSAGLEVEIPVLDTFQQWGSISVKSTTSSLPQLVYLETDYDASGFATVLVYPVPTATLTLVLYLQQRLSVVALTAPIKLPDGYLRAIRLQLAVELGPEFNTPVRPDIIALAASAMGWLKSRNSRPRPMGADFAALGSGDDGGRYYGRWLDYEG
jgi:hypothetical protein